MKTEHEINKNIIEITMAIDEKFPELSKYILTKCQLLYRIPMSRK